MKEKTRFLTALLAVLLSATVGFAQSGSSIATGTFKLVHTASTTSHDPSDAKSIAGLGLQSFQVLWTGSGTRTSCAGAVEISDDGKSWSDGIVIADCTTNNTSAVTELLTNYIRINPKTMTGADNTVTFTLIRKAELGSVTVSGNVTANAGTDLNTSALAIETGGNLAAAAMDLAAIEVLITSLNGYVDQLEGYVDNLEIVLGTIDTDTGNIATSTSSLDTKLGEVQATPTANTVLGRLDDLDTLITTLNGYVDTLETLLADVSTETTQATLALETGGNLAAIATDAAAIEVLITSLNGYVDQIEEYVDGLESDTGAMVVDLAAIELLLDVLDDWDDGNYANVNMNVAGADVVKGGGAEANAILVTLANDSTGVVSVDDNGSTISVDDGGSTISVDGTVTANAGAADPCQTAASTTLPVSVVTDTELVAAAGGDKVYVCSALLVAAAAEVINFVEGTGTVCATSKTALVGSTTDANGVSLAANGGFVVGSGDAAPFHTNTAGNALCLTLSGTNRVSGYITYVQQ